jgi:hypothetical protein
MGGALGLRLQVLAVPSVMEFDSAFSAMVQERAEGVVVLSTPLFMGAAPRLAELAIKWPHEPGQAQPDKLGPQTHVAHPTKVDARHHLVPAS